MKKLCKNIKPGTFVALEVVDNSTATNWSEKDGARKVPPMSLLYWGEFLGENDDFIHIAGMGGSEGAVKDIHVICKTYIMWIDVVTKVNRIYKTDKFDKYFKLA